MNDVYPRFDPETMPMPQSMRLELIQSDLEEFNQHAQGIYKVLEVEISERKKSDEKIRKAAKRWNIISAMLASASLLVAIAAFVFSVLKAA